ncbi:lytic transglycosylase catalytic [Caballeronia arationis]|uniref:lytic transglycosylase domain-containing protein n=1 Tax=Caballeronia arationis TaxID=1777142 RepID=UPI00074B9529|nr:lytic transglycosylase domain-containing protein [Caballeronia arationis]SAL00276.1 lytic transglycosylase catalytic [Caballeronia arationis]
MRTLNVVTVVSGVFAAALIVAAAPVPAQLPPQSLPFEKLAAECAPDVHPTTLKGVVSTESSWNPYAIGVVGGRLDHQPRNLAEAIATARELDRQGFNFSVGLGQVNRYNLARYGESYETAFEPCRNLKAGSAILKHCFQRAKAQIGDEQQALRAAFSCYYSGNFTRGFRTDIAGQPSYVRKVVANAMSAAQPIPVMPAVQPGSSVAAVTEPPSGRSGAPAKHASSGQWVIFADGPKQGGNTVPAEDADAIIKRDPEPPVKVQLTTPANGVAQSDAAVRAEQAPPVQRALPQNSGQQDPPFVQFVD